MRNALFVAALLLIVLSAAACNERALEPRKRADAGAGSALRPEQAAKVLAKVGDRAITLGDYVATLEHMDQFDRLRFQSPERRKELLQDLINVELLADEAIAKGYDKDPLAQQELRTVLRDAMLGDVRRSAGGPADVPEADVRAYYDAHRGDFRDPERRRVSLVVCDDEARAKGVIAGLRGAAMTSERWGELVRANSTDTYARTNVPPDLAGDFGFVVAPDDSRGEADRVPAEVRAAAFRGKVGEVLADVVKAAGKYYVVRVTQKSDAHQRSYAEAERTIRVKLGQERVRTLEKNLIDGLRKDFPVTIDEAALAQVKVDLPATPSDAGR